MDGLPYFDSLADRYEEQACPNSELINKRIAQKIEQGIGRGVRGEKDYCAILINRLRIGSFYAELLQLTNSSRHKRKNKLKSGLKLLTWRERIMMKLKAL